MGLNRNPNIIGGAIRSALSNGRIVKNLFEIINVEDLSLTATAGTGTPTITANNSTGIITAQVPAGLTGRAYATTPTISWVAGHTYCLSVELTYVLNATSGTNTILNVSAITVDFGVIVLARTTMDSVGRYAIIFQPTTTQTSAFRIGIGCSSAALAGASGARLDFKNIMIEDLSLNSNGITVPSPYVSPKMSAMMFVDYAATLPTQTAGKLTVTKEVYNKHKKGLYVAVFGDSFTQELNDYPGQLQRLSNPDVAVWYQIETTPGVTVSGTRPSVFLVPFQTKMQALIDANQKPTFVLLQSSINTLGPTLTVDQDTYIAEDLLAIRNAAIWAIGHDIQPIFTNISACKTAITAWLTSTKYHAQQRWDTQIFALGAELGVPVFNLRASVEDTAVPYVLAAANDSGDGMHPSSTTGMLAIATALQSFLVRQLALL